MRFVNHLRSTFTISAEGPIETFLNIRITRDIPSRTVNLGMSAYMEKLFQKFNMMWNYIDHHLIDHEHGEWYPGGLDKQPELKDALKGHIWKACYHQYRSMENCVKRLRSPNTGH